MTPQRRLLFWRRLALVSLAVAALAVAVALWALWHTAGQSAPDATPEAVDTPPPPDRLELAAAGFEELPGWPQAEPAGALPALAASCRALAGRARGDESAALAADLPQAGTLADWRRLCRRAAALPPGDDRAARAFFEQAFVPWAVTNRGDPGGFFTGYYEPTLQGSRRPDERYRFPLYLRPPELVAVELGRFREELADQRIAGRLDGDRLVPYHDRRAIDDGALAGRELELVWVDDAVDAFFLHIQGSGRIQMAGGGSLRIGYAAQNGHPYVAIGRELIDRGELTREQVSMQSIRRWLVENPDRAAELMAANPSYVFFRRLTESAPLGSLGVPLTAGRSLAVDRRFLPLGPPLWLDALAPAPSTPRSEAAGETPAAESDDPPADRAPPDRPLRRLMVAQDTGGAIRGPVRGDVFWGPGAEAADVAGRMKHPGRMWLLLPRDPSPLAAAEPSTP